MRVRLTKEKFERYCSRLSRVRLAEVQRTAVHGDGWVEIDQPSTLTSQPSTSPKGLGDVIHAILKPFVRGTRFEHCTGCAKRRESLNKLTRS
jgi:hypothetical protein